jgi:hypothetical protein
MHVYLSARSAASSATLASRLRSAAGGARGAGGGAAGLRSPAAEDAELLYPELSGDTSSVPAPSRTLSSKRPIAFIADIACVIKIY